MHKTHDWAIRSGTLPFSFISLHNFKPIKLIQISMKEKLQKRHSFPSWPNAIINGTLLNLHFMLHWF